MIIKRTDGYHRVSKRFSPPFIVPAVLLVLLALIVLYAAVFHQAIMRRWYSTRELPVFKLNSPYLADYTGNARLLLDDGTLLYEGAVENAAANGAGRLYDHGALVYEGAFSQNLYSGEGTLYGPDGRVLYRGGFDSNKYSGTGVLYDIGGEILYDGTFTAGTYDGQGTLRFEQGGEWYTYTGGFDSGLYAGNGTLHCGAELIYEGGFDSGEYSGEGKLYKDGALYYEGGFLAGVFDGDGTEYDPQTGRPVFSGSFSAGERQGAGTVFGEDGRPLEAPADPTAPPDPLVLLNLKYEEVTTALNNAGLTLMQQQLGDVILLIEEETGVIYYFSVIDGGAPGFLIYVYYYGELSVDGIAVGGDVADIERQPDEETENPGAEDSAVLGYANARQNRSISASNVQGVTYSGEKYTVTAFCVAQDAPGEILFVRIGFAAVG